MGSDSLGRYFSAALRAGLSRDHMAQLLGAGIVLQERQLVATAAAFSCDYEGGPTEVGYGGARGGGKSHWGLAQLALDCLRYPGLTCLCLRKVGKANKQNFNELRLKVLRGVSTRFLQEGVLLFGNGSKIILGHFQNESDVDAYLGLEYDVILVEEATTLSASKYKMIRTCNRSSKAGWRPRMYTTTNPGGVGHAWYKAALVQPHRQAGKMLGLGHQKGPTRFVPATVYDNGFVNREYTATLEGLSGWMKKAWLDGDWDVAAGQFFTNWRAPVHVLKPSDIPFVPGFTRSWASLDYGFTHYTAAYLLCESDGIVYFVDEHAERQWLPQRHGPGIQNMLGRHQVSLPQLDTFVAGRDVFAVKGSESGRTIADQYEAMGMYFSPADDDRISGAGEILHRLGDIDAGIEPTLYVSERCARFIESIPSLEHDPHVPEKVRKVDTDDDGIGGDDAYDGGRYGVMAAGKLVLPPLVSGAASQPDITRWKPAHQPYGR